MTDTAPNNLAILFPGQGSQALGMAADLVRAHPAARRVFDRAREVTGTDFLRLCAEGPEDELNSTRVSQPAIFLHSLAAVEALREAGVVDESFPVGSGIVAAAGLSLGEYTALAFVGCLEFDEALELVVRRGEFMQEACDTTEGGMVSIIGLAAAKVEEIVESLREDPGLEVGVANYNSPIQTVISGRKADLEQATAALADAGAKKTVPLRVAGAYHSPLMASATAQLEPYLRKAKLSAPRVPFFSNVTGTQIEDPEEIRAGLIGQIESSVRWESTVRALLEAGASQAWEIGPGKVLKGLVRNVDRGVSVLPLGTADGIEELRKERTVS